MLSESKTKTATSVVSLIGAPTDIGASCLGARMGPEALRIAGIVEALEHCGVAVLDCGDLQGPVNPNLPALDGYRHLNQVFTWCKATYYATANELALGRLPILMGGDHALAVGSISAIAAHCRAQGKKLRILWFDAHADFNTKEITPSGNLHGMPVACLCGYGPPLLTELSGFSPAIHREDIHLIGLRSVDVEEKRFLRKVGIQSHDMRTIDEMGVRHIMEEALAGVDNNTHLHISLDMDFMDPLIAPGVGTPVRGGPTYREAQLAMEMIADRKTFASLDIVELNPALDMKNSTAELAVDLLGSLFGKTTLERHRERQ